MKIALMVHYIITLFWFTLYLSSAEKPHHSVRIFHPEQKERKEERQLAVATVVLYGSF